MVPEKMKANPKVRANVGKVALQRGPIVYCLEEVDNGVNLPSIFLPEDAELKVAFEPDLLGGVVTIHAIAERRNNQNWDNVPLYQPSKNSVEQVKIKAVPYYAWCNRDKGEMLVWFHEKM
jgi:uncharacterized protein